MKDYIAFFDLDHTIINANSGKLIARHAYQNGLFSTRDMINAALWSSLHDSRFMTPDNRENIKVF